MTPQFLLAVALAVLFAFPASSHAPTPKRKPYADIEHWACQVHDGPWLKFRVIEGEMRAVKQP